ncbi:HAMP domain-containing sensor histidine kinase [Terasakiella sp. A23]|uniref:sensor histidine kinase n=1 Tax=Terasakiella sp. FCG-A23 TaxID=3080561 RepID=UPI0029543B07|nr:HAMP domain-containing sensor histidine kinase [Terasakiella sp. A23]MDV7339750.1 HAMP domain-containing sensor histidine kinase [Terasakiella sp. A23]
MPFGIRGKLISIFLLIKVIPLVLLAWMTWQAVIDFGDTAAEKSKVITDQMRQTVHDAGNLASKNSVEALDDKARESIERQTTDLARNVAQFLYERDSEILYAATMDPTDAAYQNFLKSRTKSVSDHGTWVLNESGDKWVPEAPRTNSPTLRTAQIDANKKQFSYRIADQLKASNQRPLYLEMSFIDKSGRELAKATTSSLVDAAKKDISVKSNTFIKAETYFDELKNLKPGEIYVSDVIGAYLPSKIIGPYTKATAEKKNVPFEPESSAYAGKENPVGKRFEGIVRWATPVVKNGEITGYVTLALDHRHIMEFSDHHIPTEERYSDISDAASGNYAFIWDHKARNISHPRDYFIVGYDPETGEPSVPWLSQNLYDSWQASGQSYVDYQGQMPWFLNQDKPNKPAKQLIKQGQLALDCRYLNFAPQCAGWWNLTAEGGSGSFVIFWSGLWKLTTAATIPYYTGQYAQSPRGFGFVTIGANVDEFHRAANDTKHLLESMVQIQDAKAEQQEAELFATLEESVQKTTINLTVYTGFMIIFVILIAIWMANSLSDRIKSLISDLRKIKSGDLSVRAKVTSKDEMGELASSLNDMTESLQNHIKKSEEAVAHAEASSLAKTDFLANMSHELRTPLNAIIGFSDFIRHEIRGPIQPESYKEYIDDIHVSGNHLLKLINDILDISRIGSGEVELDEEAFDMEEVLIQSKRMMQQAAEKKHIPITIQSDFDQKLYGDRRRVKQICLNLLSNAVKFSRDDGQVSLSTQLLDSGEMRLIIQDKGIGMNKQEVEIALTPFVQIQSSLSRQYEGTGLGLPLAVNLAKLHSAQLEILSEPDVGTTVMVTFPKDRVVGE